MALGDAHFPVTGPFVGRLQDVNSDLPQGGDHHEPLLVHSRV